MDIPAQDPRAIVVRAGRLYLIPFESGNQMQLSGGTGKPDGKLVTFNAWNHSIATNNARGRAGAISAFRLHMFTKP